MEELVLRTSDTEQLKVDIANEVISMIAPLLNEANEPRLLDRMRMAKRLSISVATLDRLTAANTIPSIIIKSRRLYSPTRVIEALENMETNKDDC